MNRVNTKTTDRVRLKVSLVLQIIDDFTNKEITDNIVRARIDGEKPPVRKDCGFYVFTNLQKRKAEVVIESGIYEARRINVALDDEGYRFLKVRLMPNRSYPIPADTTCVDGQAEPGSIIRIVCIDNINPMKLIYDYNADKKCEIHIFHPDAVDIEGKVLYIENGSSIGEFFRVLRKNDEKGSYTLEQHLFNAYKKIGTVIYPVWYCTADNSGRFFIPIPIKGDSGEFLCEAVGTDTVRLNRVFKTGVINKLNFNKEEL